MTVRLRRACGSPEVAARLVAAVSADNPAFVTVRAVGSDLEVELTSRSAASARATLDDLLACLQVAEKTRTESAP